MSGAASGLGTYATIAAVAFALTAAIVIVLGSTAAPDVVDRHAVTARARPGVSGVFELTVDARLQRGWLGLDFGAGRACLPGDTADVFVQRYRLRALHGDADLGRIELGGVTVGADVDWQRDMTTAGTTANAVLSSWYTYSFWTHLLESKGHSYAVRRGDGSVVYLQIVSYYCKPTGSGCLTLRYRLL